MNPLVLQFGPVELHAFTALILVGVALGIAIILGMAARRHERIMPTFDVILGGIVGGVIGARVVHVWLNWIYFSAHTDQITDYSTGGLDWHGALAFGLLGVLLVAAVRHIPLGPLLDSFALAFPVNAITVWLACATAASVYGVEVNTLANYPAWLVIESPDIYGSIAPRINLLPIGIVFALIILADVIVLTALNKLPGLRFWLALALYSLGLAVLDFFRAEYVPIWAGRRADQWLDLIVALVAILIFGGLATLRHRTPDSSGTANPSGRAKRLRPGAAIE